MVNVNKFKGKIVEKGLNIEKVAESIKMDKATLYRKLNQSGQTLTIKEVDLLANTLELSIDEVVAIFFSQHV